MLDHLKAAAVMAFLYQPNRPVAPGQLTQTVYTLVRDQRFFKAIQLLEQELQVGEHLQRECCCCAVDSLRDPDHAHHDILGHFALLLQLVSDSRPGLSLLAYCYYHSGLFEQAASTYVPDAAVVEA